MRRYLLIFILLLMIPLVLAFNFFRLDYDEVVCPGCDYFISCESDSMSPSFDCNDTLLLVKPFSKEDIKIGDVIWFVGSKEQLSQYRGDDVRFVYHRVVGFDGRGCFVTKGDNNLEVDRFHPCFYDVRFKVKGVVYG